MNFFGMLSLLLLCSSLVPFLFIIHPLSEHLCVHYCASLVAMICLCLGIITMQLDRFVAIYWDIKYKTYASTKCAVSVCIFNFFFSLILVIAELQLDSSFMKCTDFPSLIYTRYAGLVLGGLFKMISLHLTLLVSYYVLKTKKRLQNQVHPSYPLSEILPEERSRAEQTQNVRRLNSQPHIFFCIEQPSTNQTRQETPEEKDLFLMVKNTTTMNLLTLAFVIGFVPDVVLGLVHFNCEKDGDCESFITWFTIFNIVKTLYLLIVDIVALKRLLCKRSDTV